MEKQKKSLDIEEFYLKSKEFQKSFNFLKRNSGVTLVALVITMF